jgi:hypothetical protein
VARLLQPGVAQRRAVIPEWDDATWHACRFALRLERSRPVLDMIRAWLDTELPKVLPKIPIGQAIGYGRHALCDRSRTSV